MLHLLLLSALCAMAYGQCPNILTKAQWGGRAATCRTAMTTPVAYVVVHHTEGTACTTQTNCIAQAKSVQNYHMNSNGWCDAGYSFMVGEDGNVYEGRGWSSVGAHAPNYNSNSIGISVFGSYTSRNPNAAAQNAVQNLISCGVSRGFIRSTYILKGHRNVTATSCPGNTFYSTVASWPRFQA
uniref:Peptidoglycan-recognition protein n=1 Tax=Leptobrachium leishanense TaxID=445787 RepID=A0A8C5QPS2_9ANUR